MKATTALRYVVRGLATFRCVGDRIGKSPSTVSAAVRRLCGDVHVARVGRLGFVWRDEKLDMTCRDVRALVYAIEAVGKLEGLGGVVSVRPRELVDNAALSAVFTEALRPYALAIKKNDKGIVLLLPRGLRVDPAEALFAAVRRHAVC